MLDRCGQDICGDGVGGEGWEVSVGVRPKSGSAVHFTFFATIVFVVVLCCSAFLGGGRVEGAGVVVFFFVCFLVLGGYSEPP